MIALKKFCAGISAAMVLINPVASTYRAVEDTIPPETPSQTDDLIPDTSEEEEKNKEGELEEKKPEEEKPEEETPEEKMPTPTLEVNIPVQDKWSNNVDDWEIIAEDGATVYYKVNSKKITDWGSYQDANIWTDGKDLPDGKNYIKFWAVASDSERDVNDETEAKIYMLDTVPPDDFEIIEENSVLKNKDLVTDMLSGISEVRYSVGSNIFNDLQQIRESGKKAAVNKVTGGVDFSVSVTENMKGQDVIFYAIDKAGNVRTSSLTIKTPPLLTVNIPSENEWVNNISGWKISTEKDAQIYYRVSDVSLDDWGKYSDGIPWNEGKDIPEGKHYIKFWAVVPDSVRDVNDTVAEKQYQLDITPPSSFELTEKSKDVLSNSVVITDKGSGISGIYYSIGDEPITDIQKIKTNAKKIAMQKKDDGVDFSLNVTNSMKGKNIIVYVTDEAGNIRTVSKTIKTPPTLEVEIPIENEWINTIADWKVDVEAGAQVYYKVSEKLPSDWGNYYDGSLWNSGRELPEGKYYIKFWAVVPNSVRDVNNMTEVKHYQFDKTSPGEFEIIEEPQLFLKNNQVVADTNSGISAIYYSEGSKKLNTLSQIEANAKKIDLDQTENGVNFSIELTKDLKGKQLIFYAVDNAKNIRTVLSPLFDDADIPQIDNIDIVSITSDDLGFTESDKHQRYEYGSSKLEYAPYTNFLYAGDSSYFRFNIAEEHQNDVVISINVSKSVEQAQFYVAEMSKINIGDNMQEPFYFEPEAIENPNGFCVIRNDGDVSYYIPVKTVSEKCGMFPSDDKNVYNFSFRVSDGKYNHISKLETVTQVFYDPYDSQDNLIDLALSESNIQKSTDDKYKDEGLDNQADAYFYGIEKNSNYIDISMSDDTGISSYAIKLYRISSDDKELVYEKLNNEIAYGTEKTGTYTVMKEEVNESGETVSVLFEEKETYFAREKGIISEKVTLPDDGVYCLEITVTDIGGNKSVETKSYIVDSIAPVIEGMNYAIKKDIFHYLTFGIYGNNKAVLKIKVSDGIDGSGVPVDNIKLYWDKENEPYHASLDGEWFVFEELSPEHHAVPYIIITDRMKHFSQYYFKTIDSIQQTEPAEKNLVDEDTGVALILETTKPQYTVTPVSSNFRTNLGKDGNELYFGNNRSGNFLRFDFSDNEGLDHYKISIKDSSGKDINSKKAEQSFTERSKATLNCKNISVPVDDLPDGKYKIYVSVSDLAGNTSSKPVDCSFNYGDFYIDKTAPVIVDTQYEAVPSILKYLTFGIFGNSTIKISVKVQDNQYGSGVDSVELFWDDSSKPYHSSYSKDDTYIFDSLNVTNSGTPYIVVTDKMGNSNRYYFSSKQKSDNGGKTIGELIEANVADSGVELVLENEKPFVDITVPSNYVLVNGRMWYGNGITYNVKASDVVKGSNNTVHSGLEHTEVFVNDTKSPKYIENSYSMNNIKYVFNKDKFTDTASYSYGISEAGNYTVLAYAYDNAGNFNTYQKSFNIDKVDPKIQFFRFQGKNETPVSIIKDTFGYFFPEETEVRVYVSDEGISSGIKYVKLFLEKASDSQSSSSAKENINLLSDNYGTYASFIVPMGFKGKVQAEVVDNVSHTSGRMNADGSIVEDSKIHKDRSSVEIIAADEEHVPRDANNIPLYNSKTVPVTVTVTDTFSGIEKIEWYIANDRKQGTISVDINGKYTSDSQEAVIAEEDILRDANLVTKISFGINVTDNSNGNAVTVKLTDRAGNTSDLQKMYSIDCTMPQIQTVLSGEPVNDKYYSTSQTITIKIKERNFNAQKIEFYINNDEQEIDDNKKVVADDSTEYSYSFEVSNDGEYNCYVSYTDDAGNTSSDRKTFIIDTISPKITNNFSDFKLQEVTDEEGNRKELYFRLEEDTENDDKEDDNKLKPIVLTITVEEVNFMPSDILVKQYRKSPGNEHTDSEWYETELMFWKGSGNIHTMTINIGPDNNGVYKFVIESAVDHAGNTAIFESPEKTDIFEVDSKIPVISVRNDRGSKIEDNGDTYISMYDYDRRNEESPSVTFKDDNIAKVEYTLTQYTPEYTSGKEIGRIEPKVTSGVIEYESSGENKKTITYKLDQFDTDGVYSVVLQAFDKAGNTSGKILNTYVRMVNLSVLAYIEESDSEQHTGWYSFSEFSEKGESRPISKRPDSFEDLKIVVFAAKDTETSVLLYDKNLENSTDTNITSAEDSCFDNTMYYFGAYRYILPSSYFSNNYKDDTDTNLYLRVTNDGVSLSLGEIYIDNKKPTYRVENPNVKNWGYISGFGDQIIQFEKISEVLDTDRTVAYVDDKEIHLSSKEYPTIFSYEPSEGKLKLILSPGSHKIGLVLVDKAGNQNTQTVSEIKHLAVGVEGLWQNYGLIVIIFVSIVIVFILFIIIRRVKSKS